MDKPTMNEPADRPEVEMENRSPKTPEAIKPLSASWKNGAWLDYTVMELGWWVHLYAKRAQHRAAEQPEKRAKDLRDARNYWHMMGAHLDALEANAIETAE